MKGVERSIKDDTHSWVQKCRFAKFGMSPHVQNVYDKGAGVATRVCLQKILRIYAKVWMCIILHIHTRAKCIWCVGYYNQSLFAKICENIRMCEICTSAQVQNDLRAGVATGVLFAKK